MATEIVEYKPASKWVLTDEEFAIWWASLDPDDRAEFTYGLGGSPRLARFVCCLDRLLVRGGSDGAKGTIKEAWAIATGNPLAKADAAYGPSWLRHPAVQALLGRLRHRERIVAWVRIEQKYSDLVERALDHALEHPEDFKTLDIALKAAATFGKTVSLDDVKLRTERTKRGFEAAREAMDSASKPSQDQLRAWLKGVHDDIGPDAFADLLSEVARPKLQA